MKACIFDLDGTLINSLEDLAEGINRMLDDHGYPRQPIEAFPLYIGDGVRSLVLKALPESVLESEDIEARVADYQRHYQDTWKDKTSPYPGITDLLKTLHAEGFKLAVLSNKPHAFTQLCCDHFFPDVSFEVVFGARPNVPRKPDPAGAFEIAEILGLKPDECAFIGDSGFDMATAVNAGMLPVGVTWGFRDEEELRSFGAKVLISQAEELLAVLR